MENLIILFGISTLIILLIILFVILTNRQPKDSQSSQMMLGLLNELRQELNQSGGQNRKEMQERLDYMIHQLGHHHQHNSNRLDDQHRFNSGLIKDITQQLAYIEKTNRQVLGFAQQMESLEKILKNPKQRGILGEYFLENMLQNVFPPSNYKMQYSFKNGEIVDAALFVKGTIIPVDAKFSLEKYNRLIQAQHQGEKDHWDKSFRNDVKRRINETSKYIRPEENTTDFAFMFLPAEGIYHHLLSLKIGSHSNGNDIVEYAFKKRVILVSPASFYAYLETVMQGLKALQIEDSVKEVISKVGELSKHLNQFEDHIDRMGKQLGTVVNTFNQAGSAYKRIDKDILKITEGEKGSNFEPTRISKPVLE